MHLHPATLRPRKRHQTHRPARILMHSYTHTHTPVAVDPHFLHRRTPTPGAHTRIYRSAHDSPLGRRKCLCAGAHRRPSAPVWTGRCADAETGCADVQGQRARAHTRGRGQVKTAGAFINSCILHLSPQVALPGRQSTEKAASGPWGHQEPELAIDFCLSLGIRTGSSEREPVRSAGGPARGQPRACHLEREQRRPQRRGCGEQTPLQAESSPARRGAGGRGCVWPGRRSRWTTGWDPGVQGSALPWKGGAHRLLSRLPLPGLNPDPFACSGQPCTLPVAAQQPPSTKRTELGLQRVRGAVPTWARGLGRDRAARGARLQPT